MNGEFEPNAAGEQPKDDGHQDDNKTKLLRSLPADANGSFEAHDFAPDEFASPPLVPGGGGSGRLARSHTPRGHSDGRTAAISAIVAALIGGIFGFSGSYFVYQQSQNALAVEERRHAKDVQREAFVDFLAKAAEARGKYLVVGYKSGMSSTDEMAEVSAAYAAMQLPLNKIYLLSPGPVADRARELDRQMLAWSTSLEGAIAEEPSTTAAATSNAGGPAVATNAGPAGNAGGAGIAGATGASGSSEASPPPPSASSTVPQNRRSRSIGARANSVTMNNEVNERVRAFLAAAHAALASN